MKNHMDIRELIASQTVTPEQAERLIAAAEKFAAGFNRLADVAERIFNRNYPERGEPQDATVTRVPTEEDLIRQEQSGDISQPIEEWVGPRELAYTSGQSAKAPEKPKRRRAEKVRRGPRKTGRDA